MSSIPEIGRTPMEVFVANAACIVVMANQGDSLRRARSVSVGVAHQKPVSSSSMSADASLKLDGVARPEGW
ncbi:MAG TPA: hypothetical protein VIR33_15500 [Thermopolyspora sp.]|jgi:hypothetical protein